jgi:hypothetical protein
MAAKRRKKHKKRISGLVISMCYNEQKSKFRPFTNPINKTKSQRFGILNLGHCDLFGICDLLFVICYLLKPEHRNLTPHVPYNMLSDKS